MCIKPVDTHPTMKYLPDQYKTQEICVKAGNTYSFKLHSVPDQQKSQEMCYKAVDDNTSALKFVPD